MPNHSAKFYTGLQGIVNDCVRNFGTAVETNFNKFPTLAMNETPPIDVHIVPSNLDPTGIGEPGLPPTAPALTNAIFAATGKRIRRLPIKPADFA